MSSASRSIQVLEYLASAPDATHSELAANLGIAKSTLSNLLAELRALSCVEIRGNRVSLGPRMFALAHRIRQISDAPVVRDLLRAIADAVGETAHFSIETGGSPTAAGVVLPIDCAESAHEMRVTAMVGKPRPMLGTAAGRVLLAVSGRSSASVLDAFDKPPRRRGGTTADRLRAELDEKLQEVRDGGFEIFDDNDAGYLTVALPVFAEDGPIPLGAISVSGPRARMEGRTAKIMARAQQLIVDRGLRVTAR